MSLLAAALLHGCATRDGKAQPPPDIGAVAAEGPEWERVALGFDGERLNSLDRAWEEALGASRAASFRRSIAAEGPLLKRDAALLRPQPAPGSYLCRLIQIGSTDRRDRAFNASKPSFCYVGVDEQNRLWLAKQTGALRRQGFLWDDDLSSRMVFLGALANGSKDTPPAYGEPERSMAGVFERVGPLRYRLVTPYPNGFKLEVIELTPAPVQPEE